MRSPRRRVRGAAAPLPAAVLVALAAGCAPTGGAADRAAPAATPPAALAATRWHAVLAAGYAGIPVWDAATDRMAALLDASGRLAAPPRRLSAARARVESGAAEPATREDLLRAIAALRPGPGEGCLVFVTSHGTRDAGLDLPLSRAHLTPRDLDAALSAGGCAAAPTVAILSGCYAGQFAAWPVARPNRVVLAAARSDLPSFGCSTRFEVTVFDGCLIAAMAQAGEGGGGWPAAMERTRGCVRAQEAALGENPSRPQAAFGAAAAGLPVPAPAAAR